MSRNVLITEHKYLPGSAALFIFGALTLTATVPQSVFGQPLVLNNAQLDQISAGYVNLQGTASAAAEGDIAVADIFVNSTQTITPHADERVTYTVSTITAKAAAIGEQVDTSVSAGFETDEQVISVHVSYSASSGLSTGKPLLRGQVKSARKKAFYRKRNHHKAGKNPTERHNRNLVIFQSESVKLTVITAQPY